MRWNSGIEWGDDHILKLISCYIENFGGLSKYSIQFQPGITVIEEPNGFGKTTLAEFIRAMFYGFPRASKTLEKNSRKKYLPWQGESTAEILYLNMRESSIESTELLVRFPGKIPLFSLMLRRAGAAWIFRKI